MKDEDEGIEKRGVVNTEQEKVAAAKVQQAQKPKQPTPAKVDSKTPGRK